MEKHYRFNLRAWLMNLPPVKRNEMKSAIIKESNQSLHTIRRIMYMAPDDQTYVRPETKEVICKVFNRTLQELENTLND